MSLNIGMNIVEVDGKATPSIQAAPTSVTGFIIKSQRGIPGKVRRVTNWSQFREHFGEYTSDAYGAYSVRGFFDNGGQTAFVTRIQNAAASSGTAASVTSNVGPWNLDDGDTVTFSLDGGADIAAIFVDGPAVVNSAAETFDLSTNNVLGFTVNGVVADDYTFVVSDAADLTVVTADEVAAVINREFSGIRASVSAGVVTVRTDRGDSSATLEVTGSAATEIGFGAVTAASGNVANIDNVTMTELATILDDVLGAGGVTVSLTGAGVKVTHGTAGSAHSIQVVAGGVSITLGFDNLVHSGTDSGGAGGAVASTFTFKTGAADALTVTAAYRGEEDKGAWGDGIGVAIVADDIDTTRFEVQVQFGGNVVETWSNLSMDSADASNRFVESIINDEFSGSKYIMVAASGTTRPDETKTAGAIYYESLAGGSNGAFDSEADMVNAAIAAIDLYDIIDIQLMCCPETDSADLVNAGLTHCKNKGDRMFAGFTPLNWGAADISNYTRDLKGDKVYGAMYFPWIQVNDPLGTRIWIPPVGHVLGVYARTERERGIWKAPAGNAAKLSGALDIKYHINDIDHTSLVKKSCVNAIRSIPGQGIVIDSSRTLSTNPLWLYVNVRLLFNYVKSSLVSGLRWVVQEPHDESLWNKVKFNSVTPFLMGLWRRGAFGPGTPAEVFTVKVDGENNPPANIQQGIFTAEIYFYPSRPAETIKLVVGQQEGAGSASEG